VDKSSENSAIAYFFIQTLPSCSVSFRGNLLVARFARWSGCTTTCDQVVDKDNYGDDQEKMDQTACYVEAEAQKPQNY